MPLDFPASPITGATYTAPNGTLWVWDGAKWANGVYIGTAYAPINAPTFTGDARAVTPAAGDADTSVATTAFVSAAVAPAFNGVGRNLLHNPLFNVAQRGAGPWTTGYTADRWALAVSNDTSTVAVAFASDAIRTAIGDEAATSLLSLGVNGNAAAAAFTFVSQKIEGVRRLSGKTVIASFWASASGATKLGVNMMQDFGTGGSPSAAIWLTAVPLTLSPTWTRYSATFVIPSSAGKTLGTANNDETTLALWVSCGTSNAAIAGTPGVQTGTINIWGVQLEVGSVATPLEKPDPRYDLANCQRFYQGSAVIEVLGAAYIPSVYVSTMVGFPVTMRAAPTLTVTWTTQTNTTAPAVALMNVSGMLASVQGTAAGTVILIGNFTASADL